MAISNSFEELWFDRVDSMGRHVETDEVLVLPRGRGSLSVGGKGPKVDGIRSKALQAGEIYHAKREAWHTIQLSGDVSVLLVGNPDTGAANPELHVFSRELRVLIPETARLEQTA